MYFYFLKIILLQIYTKLVITYNITLYRPFLEYFLELHSDNEAVQGH